MFNNPYPFCQIGKDRPQNELPKEIITYKFKAKYRIYLVIIEVYLFGIVALKYCDRKDKGAKNAYSKVFDEDKSDAIRIITTCLFIMRSYWKKFPNVNFSFHGSHRPLNDQAIKRRKIENRPELIEEYKRSRFRIYKYAMYNLFDPEYFEHSFDYGNSIYLLMNKKELEVIKVKKELINFLSDHYEVLFDDV